MDERLIIDGFIIPSKRERYRGFVASRRARSKFIEALYHSDDFDPAVVVELPPSSDTSEGVLRELRRRGAGDTCYILSNDDDLDKVTMPLAAAVNRVFAAVEGTIISCIPGLLAYYEGEPPKHRFILHRKAG